MNRSEVIAESSRTVVEPDGFKDLSRNGIRSSLTVPRMVVRLGDVLSTPLPQGE